MHGHRARPCTRLQRFLVFSLQATLLSGFLLNFADGLLWQGSGQCGHPILLVAKALNYALGSQKRQTF